MKTKDIVFWSLVLTILILCIYVIYFLKSEGGQCLNSPLVYGVNQYKSSNGEFTCSCSSPFSNQILTVTKDNLSLQDSYYNIQLNSSKLFKLK